MPAASIHVMSFWPTVSTTSVSPSQWPIESPSHVSSAFGSCGAAVQEDLAPDVRAAFVDDPDLFRRLKEAPWIRRRAHARDAGRQTARFRVLAAERGLALVVDRLRLGQHRHLDAGANHVHVLADGIRLPVAGEIRLSIGRARRWSGGRPVGVPAAPPRPCGEATLEVTRIAATAATVRVSESSIQSACSGRLSRQPRLRSTASRTARPGSGCSRCRPSRTARSCPTRDAA